MKTIEELEADLNAALAKEKMFGDMVRQFGMFASGKITAGLAEAIVTVREAREALEARECEESTTPGE